MYCKNCKTLIEDDCEVCPFCGKDPKKISLKPFITAAVIIIVCGAVLAFAFNATKGKPYLKPTISVSDVQPTLTSTSQQASESTVQPTLTSDIQQILTSGVSQTEKSTTDNVQNDKYASSLNEASLRTFSINDKGDKTYAVTKIKKDALKAESYAAIAAFCDKYFSKNGSLWLSFAFPDGTCLTFYGSKSAAVYGKADEFSIIKDVYGSVLLVDKTKYVYRAATLNSGGDKVQIQPGDEEKTVYVTAMGKKYHKETCSYLTDSKIAISLAEAKERGYTPCSRCMN